MATRGTFYEVTVELELTTSGKTKKQKEYYLVVADSVTYAEAQVGVILENEATAVPWVVTSAKKSKVTLVEPEDYDAA